MEAKNLAQIKFREMQRFVATASLPLKTHFSRNKKKAISFSPFTSKRDTTRCPVTLSEMRMRHVAVLESGEKERECPRIFTLASPRGTYVTSYALSSECTRTKGPASSSACSLLVFSADKNDKETRPVLVSCVGAQPP